MTSAFCRFPSRSRLLRDDVAGAYAAFGRFHRAVLTIACEAARLSFLAPPTRHIFVAAINVGVRAEIGATRVGKRRR